MRQRCKEQLEAVTGERISALEGIGAMSRDAPVAAGESARESVREPRIER